MYEKIIYYSVDKGAFDARDVAEMHRRAEEEVKDYGQARLDQYAPIINKFIENTIKMLGFTTDRSSIAKRLKEAYRSEFEEHGVTREHDAIEDVVENLLAGIYGLRPLNRRVAYDAVKLLDGTSIDLEDKTVRMVVDEENGLIIFKVEEKAPPTPPKPTPAPVTPPEVPGAVPPPPPPPGIEQVPLALPDKVDVTDLTRKLSEVVRTFEGEVSSVVLGVKGGREAKISASAELKDIRPGTRDEQAMGSLINVFNFLADTYAARLSVTLRFKRKVEIEKLRAILGNYFPKRLATFDEWLS